MTAADRERTLGTVPIPFAPLIGFTLGVLFAWVSRESLARDDGPLVASHTIAVAAAFAVLVFAPVTGYFVAFHADWAYLYLVPSARVPSAVDLALVLFAGLMVPVGAAVAAAPARQRRAGAIVWLTAVPGVLLGALFAWGARRLAVSASYAQFHGDFGTASLWRSALGKGVLFMTLVLAAAVVWGVRSLVPRRTNPAGRLR